MPPPTGLQRPLTRPGSGQVPGEAGPGVVLETGRPSGQVQEPNLAGDIDSAMSLSVRAGELDHDRLRLSALVAAVIMNGSCVACWV